MRSHVADHHQSCHLKGEGAVSRDEDDMLEGQACNAPEVFLPSQVEKAKGYLESG